MKFRTIFLGLVLIVGAAQLAGTPEQGQKAAGVLVETGVNAAVGVLAALGDAVVSLGDESTSAGDVS